MKTLKSVWAVVAGFLVVVVLSTITDAILEKLGVFPDGGLFVVWMLLLAFIYRSVYTVLGGYVTAKLAPTSPIRHVYVLAILGTLGGLVGVVVGWNLSAHWYPIALAVTAFPLVWWGGRIGTSKHTNT